MWNANSGCLGWIVFDAEPGEIFSLFSSFDNFLSLSFFSSFILSISINMWLFYYCFKFNNVCISNLNINLFVYFPFYWMVTVECVYFKFNLDDHKVQSFQISLLLLHEYKYMNVISKFCD